MANCTSRQDGQRGLGFKMRLQTDTTVDQLIGEPQLLGI